MNIIVTTLLFFDSLLPVSVRHVHMYVSPCTCLSSIRQRPSYGDCLGVKKEYYKNCSVLDCVTQCSQSAAHLYEQFLQVQQIGFVTSGPLPCA